MRDHRQLDLFGGAGHRHGAQIRRVVLALVASIEACWNKPAAQHFAFFTATQWASTYSEVVMLLPFLSYIGCRWAARRLDRKRFAGPYMTAAKRSRRLRALADWLRL